MYLKFIGTLFMNALGCIIIPLVIPALITAIGNMNKEVGGKMAGYTLLYYTFTTVVAIILGIVLVVAIRPGNSTGSRDNVSYKPARNGTLPDSVLDLIRKMVPSNIVEATIKTPITDVIFDETDPGHKIEDLETWNIKPNKTSRSNILGLIVAAVGVGLAFAAIGGSENSITLLLLGEINNIMMLITKWIIFTSPFCLIFLIAGNIVGMDEPEKALTPMLLYFATVLVGIFIHGLAILPLLYWIITRKNPYRFMLNMANVLMMAFGTASSMAVLPLNMEVTEKKNFIDYRVTRFVLPLGATVNMDGTALYEAVAAIFVAQYTQVELGPVSYIVITITATIASMGAAGIPQAGLVTMVLVFNAVGLATENIALILPLDWLLDRFRTTLNVLGDAFGSAVVYHVCRKGLEEIDEKQLHKTKKDDESAKKRKNKHSQKYDRY